MNLNFVCDRCDRELAASLTPQGQIRVPWCQCTHEPNPAEQWPLAARKRWHEISYWLGIGEDNEASGCIAQLMEFDGISAEAIWEAAVSAGVEAPVLENVKQRLEKEGKL